VHAAVIKCSKRRASPCGFSAGEQVLGRPGGREKDKRYYVIDVEFNSVNPERRCYFAWLLLCGVLSAHVADEALTGFLDLYNAAVTAMGLPSLQFTFPVWITLLALAIAGLLILSYWVRRGTWWTVHAGYVFAFLMLANGIAHLSFSIHRRAWMSGAYTSPVLVAASLNLGTATVRRTSYRQSPRLEKPTERR
jgi:hypothetical protein